MYKGIILVSLLVALRKYSDKTNIRKEKVTLLIVQGYCLLKVFIAVRRHRDHDNSYDSFRGGVQYCHGRKHGDLQADLVL